MNFIVSFWTNKMYYPNFLKLLFILILFLSSVVVVVAVYFGFVFFKDQIMRYMSEKIVLLILLLGKYWSNNPNA